MWQGTNDGKSGSLFGTPTTSTLSGPAFKPTSGGIFSNNPPTSLTKESNKIDAKAGGQFGGEINN